MLELNPTLIEFNHALIELVCTLIELKCDLVELVLEIILNNCTHLLFDFLLIWRSLELSLHNVLWSGYSNAAVLSISASLLDLVNTIETKQFCASSSNLVDMLTMTRG